MTTWGRDAAQSHEGRGLTRCVAHPDTRQGRTGPDAGVACGKRLAGLADDNRVALSDRVSVVLKPFSDARATAHAMRRKKMRAAIPRAPARLGSWHSKRQYRVSSFPEGPRGWLLSPLHRHVQEYLASLRQDGSADLGRMLRWAPTNACVLSHVGRARRAPSQSDETHRPYVAVSRALHDAEWVRGPTSARSSTRKRLRTPSASPSTPGAVPWRSCLLRMQYTLGHRRHLPAASACSQPRSWCRREMGTTAGPTSLAS